MERWKICCYLLSKEKETTKILNEKKSHKNWEQITITSPIKIENMETIDFFTFFLSPKSSHFGEKIKYFFLVRVIGLQSSKS